MSIGQHPYWPFGSMQQVEWHGQKLIPSGHGIELYGCVSFLIRVDSLLAMGDGASLGFVGQLLIVEFFKNCLKIFK